MNLKKIKGKFEMLSKKTLPYVVPHNSTLRPKGYYSSVDEYIKKHGNERKIYHEVYPSFVSKLGIPDYLLKSSSPSLNYTMEADESAKFILDVKNGRVYTDKLITIAVIAEDNKLINEVSLDLNVKNHRVEKSAIFKRKYFEDVVRFNGTLFTTVGGGGSYINYYHWLIDSFARIHLLKKANLFDEVDWFYVPTIKYDYQRDSMKAIGVPEEKIIESTKYPHVQADRVLAPSYIRGGHYHIHDWVVDFFYNEFPPNDGKKFKGGRYYISRKDSSMRNIRNEDDVIDMLEQYGFEPIILSKLSFQDKINLFANASIIIGGSGAGMTNFMFCKEGTTVVEIFGDQFVDFSHYYVIAAKRKLNYHYVVGKNVSKVRNMVEGQKTDVIVDLNALREVLGKQLSLFPKQQPKKV